MSIQVNYRETLVTYLNSETLDRAAENLGVSKAALQSRLNTLRKAGVKVPLKKRAGGFTDLEVAQLNSLIKKYKESK